MARDGWHIGEADGWLTVSRRVPVRWDVSARTSLPDAGRRRVAMQVRQDLWRVLRDQRGFAPAVAVRRAGGRLEVRAGGRIEAPHDRRRVEAMIAALLARPQARGRWMRCARLGASSGWVEAP